MIKTLQSIGGIFNERGPTDSIETTHLGIARDHIVFFGKPPENPYHPFCELPGLASLASWVFWAVDFFAGNQQQPVFHTRQYIYIYIHNICISLAQDDFLLETHWKKASKEFKQLGGENLIKIRGWQWWPSDVRLWFLLALACWLTGWKTGGVPGVYFTPQGFWRRNSWRNKLGSFSNRILFRGGGDSPNLPECSLFGSPIFPVRILRKTSGTPPPLGQRKKPLRTLIIICPGEGNYVLVCKVLLVTLRYQVCMAWKIVLQILRYLSGLHTIDTSRVMYWLICKFSSNYVGISCCNFCDRHRTNSWPTTHFVGHWEKESVNEKNVYISYPVIQSSTIDPTWRMGSQLVTKWLITMVIVFVPKTWGNVFDPFHSWPIFLWLINVGDPS